MSWEHSQTAFAATRVNKWELVYCSGWLAASSSSSSSSHSPPLGAKRNTFPPEDAITRGNKELRKMLVPPFIFCYPHAMFKKKRIIFTRGKRGRPEKRERGGKRERMREKRKGESDEKKGCCLVMTEYDQAGERGLRVVMSLRSGLLETEEAACSRPPLRAEKEGRKEEHRAGAGGGGEESQGEALMELKLGTGTEANEWLKKKKVLLSNPHPPPQNCRGERGRLTQEQLKAVDAFRHMRSAPPYPGVNPITAGFYLFGAGRFSFGLQLISPPPPPHSPPPPTRFTLPTSGLWWLCSKRFL
ncbi:hypothetical protein L345_06002, partial [Ophiophagus hannah]